MPLSNLNLLSRRNIGVPDRLGDERPQQRPAALKGPSGDAPVRRNETLDLDQVEDLDEAPVVPKQRADGVGFLTASSRPSR